MVLQRQSRDASARARPSTRHCCTSQPTIAGGTPDHGQQRSVGTAQTSCAACGSPPPLSAAPLSGCASSCGTAGVTKATGLLVAEVIAASVPTAVPTAVPPPLLPPPLPPPPPLLPLPPLPPPPLLLLLLLRAQRDAPHHHLAGVAKGGCRIRRGSRAPVTSRTATFRGGSSAGRLLLPLPLMLPLLLPLLLLPSCGLTTVVTVTSKRTVWPPEGRRLLSSRGSSRRHTCP